MASLGHSKANPLDELLNRRGPTKWQQFLNRPCLFLAKLLYSSLPVASWDSIPQKVTIICILDNNNSWPQVPEAETLIHAGDLTQSGSLKELQAQLDWLNALPQRHKVLAAGNHDLLLDSQPPNCPITRRKRRKVFAVVRASTSRTRPLHCPASIDESLEYTAAPKRPSKETGPFNTHVLGTTTCEKIPSQRTSTSLSPTVSQKHT
jgi:hypothetical protein